MLSKLCGVAIILIGMVATILFGYYLLGGIEDGIPVENVVTYYISVSLFLIFIIFISVMSGLLLIIEPAREEEDLYYVL